MTELERVWRDDPRVVTRTVDHFVIPHVGVGFRIRYLPESAEWLVSPIAGVTFGPCWWKRDLVEAFAVVLGLPERRPASLALAA